MASGLARLGQLFPLSLLRPAFRSLQSWLLRKRYLRESRILRSRWSRVEGLDSVATASSADSVALVVINLAHRTDRIAAFASEMRRLGVDSFEVVEGVLGKELYPELPVDFSGAIGCNLAHSRAVSALRPGEHAAVMVCEDDVEFLVAWPEVQQIISEFLGRDNLDVLCLAGRVRGPKFGIGGGLNVAAGIVGQACYVVKPHMVEQLSNLWISGVKDLKRKRLRGKNDIAWKELQLHSAFFAYPEKQIARQRASYSDIQGRQMPVQDST